MTGEQHGSPEGVVGRLTIRTLLRGGIADLGLTPAQALVILYLRDRADSTGASFPSQVRMAKELGLSRYGVQLCIDRLVSIGIVTVTAKIKGRSNGYRITQHANSVGTQPANSTGQVANRPHANSVGTKYLPVTEHGLPDLSKALRAADTADATELHAEGSSSEMGGRNAGSTRAQGAPATEHGATSRAGNEAAERAPKLETRKTMKHVPAQPQYTRGVAWATAIPGNPGAWKEPAA